MFLGVLCLTWLFFSHPRRNFVFDVSAVILFCRVFLAKSDNMKILKTGFSLDKTNTFVWSRTAFVFFVSGLCFLFTSPSEFGFLHQHTDFLKECCFSMTQLCAFLDWRMRHVTAPSYLQKHTEILKCFF